MDLKQWWLDNNKPAICIAEYLYREQKKPCGDIKREDFRQALKDFKNEYTQQIVDCREKLEKWRKQNSGNFRSELQELVEKSKRLNQEYKKEEPPKEEKKPKILYFDIETTDFNAGFGIMLMFAYRWHFDDTETKVIKINDNPLYRTLPPEKADFYLVQELKKIIDESDIQVAHFGSKFDIKFLQTRLIFHDLQIANSKWKTFFDTCITARKNFKFSRNSLSVIAKALGCDNEKSSLPLTVWQHSKCIGYEPYFTEALEQMADYCKQDVDTLYDIAQKLWPKVIHLPSYQAITGKSGIYCPQVYCGSYEYEYIGSNASKTTAHSEYRCKACGFIFKAGGNIRDFHKSEKVMY
jgi:uncharacterized protein YprB with RNaseH-like and TPR domain